MVDPIQRGSTIPIPQHQTVLGGQDRMVAGSPRAAEESARTRSDAAGDQAQDDFEAYLNQQSITTQQQVQPKARFDTADAIASGSVYHDPGRSTPV